MLKAEWRRFDQTFGDVDRSMKVIDTASTEGPRRQGGDGGDLVLLRLRNADALLPLLHSLALQQASHS